MWIIFCEIKRLLRERGLWVGVFLMVSAGLFSDFDIVQAAQKGLLSENMGAPFLQLATGNLRSSLFTTMLPFAASLGYVASFLNEYKSKYIRFALPRVGKMRYCFSKTLVCALSGLICALISSVIILVIYKISLPTLDTTMQVLSFAITWETYLQSLLLISLGGVLWALFSVIVSVYTLNRFATYCAPFIVYYVFTIFQKRYYSKLHFTSPYEWLTGMNLSFPAVLSIVIVLIFLLFASSIFLMQRRLKDV